MRIPEREREKARKSKRARRIKNSDRNIEKLTERESVRGEKKRDRVSE